MLAGVDLEDRADRRVDLGIHRDHVLAVLERVERNAGAEVDRSGHVDEHVDLLRAAEEERIVRDDRTSGSDGVFELRPASRR